MKEIAERFEKLFQGLHRAHGQYRIDVDSLGAGKVAGRATTVLEPLTVEKWINHLEGKLGVGAIPIRDDATCSWGAIDIDTYPLDIPQLEAKLKEFNLPLVPCRTKSGGAHLYLFLNTPVSADKVRNYLMKFASVLGYPGVEIFPKQVKLASTRDVGNWINMPYFDSDKTDRYAIIGGKKAAVLQFLKRAESIQNMLTEEKLSSIAIKETESFSDGPPCLQALSLNKIPQGARNEGLFAMGVYSRLKFGDDWESEVTEYNRLYVDPPLPFKEVGQVIKSLNRKNYFYPCSKAPIVGFCNKEVCKHREFGIGQGDSDEPSINVGTLVKILSDPPTWIIDVDGVRLELNTDDLLSQDKFRKICMEKINKLPNRIKPFKWEKMVKEKLENVELIEAPPDASTEGRFIQLVEAFCTGQAQARHQDELLAGKPWSAEGRTYFRSADLARYLDQQHFRELTNKEQWAALRRNGASHHQFNIKGKCVQCWSINEFAQQSEDFSIPEMEKDF
jgi:hypothetical protein